MAIATDCDATKGAGPTAASRQFFAIIDDVKDAIYPFIAGLLLGLIPLGILERIGWNIPYLKSKFYGNPTEIPTLVFGYHFHHSLLGLLSIGWGTSSLFNKSRNPYFWLGLGMGIIAAHTVDDGRLIFIEKVK